MEPPRTPSSLATIVCHGNLQPASSGAGAIGEHPEEAHLDAAQNSRSDTGVGLPRLSLPDSRKVMSHTGFSLVVGNSPPVTTY